MEQLVNFTKMFGGTSDIKLSHLHKTYMNVEESIKILQNLCNVIKSLDDRVGDISTPDMDDILIKTNTNFKETVINLFNESVSKIEEAKYNMENIIN